MTKTKTESVIISDTESTFLGEDVKDFVIVITTSLFCSHTKLKLFSVTRYFLSLECFSTLQVLFHGGQRGIERASWLWQSKDRLNESTSRSDASFIPRAQHLPPLFTHINWSLSAFSYTSGHLDCEKQKRAEISSLMSSVPVNLFFITS